MIICEEFQNESNLKLCHNSTTQLFKTRSKTDFFFFSFQVLKRSVHYGSIKCIECKNITSKKKQKKQKSYFRGRSFPQLSVHIYWSVSVKFHKIKFLRIKNNKNNINRPTTNVLLLSYAYWILFVFQKTIFCVVFFCLFFCSFYMKCKHDLN